ncbi:hypothetical protein QE357_002724 [Siphonobacter sp. BAB-5404]|nr:hypothetical protein [Siphonobacter sp. SORGH_AS_0500]
MKVEWVQFTGEDGMRRWRLIRLAEESRLDGIPKRVISVLGGIDQVSKSRFQAYLQGGNTCPFHDYSCAFLWILMESDIT